MPKTFPIMIEVEEIALGAVLRKLNEMPGIAKLNLDLGHGGQGPAKKQLEKQVTKVRETKISADQAVIKLLLHGPKSLDEISAHIGGHRTRAYGATSSLRKQGLIEAGEVKGMHQLTAKAREQLGAHRALPAPAAKPVAKTPSGRAAPGSGPIILRAALDAGPAAPSDLRQKLASQGMSPKGVSGVLDRAKRDGIIKKNGSDLYELTAKGMKIELGATANG